LSLEEGEEVVLFRWSSFVIRDGYSFAKERLFKSISVKFAMTEVFPDFTFACHNSRIILIFVAIVVSASIFSVLASLPT
jgi:hypothetical protein